MSSPATHLDRFFNAVRSAGDDMQGMSNVQLAGMLRTALEKASPELFPDVGVDQDKIGAALDSLAQEMSIYLDEQDEAEPERPRP